MTSPLLNLTRVDFCVSSVLSSNLEETWRHARDFSGGTYWSQSRGDFAVRKMKGPASTEIGSGRMFRVGTGRLFERLTALDDIKHHMRWILVSHPQTSSPFGEASFLNYSSKLRFRRVTDTDETYGEWKGQFYTEPQFVEEMESLLSGWYHAGFEGLQVTAGGQVKEAVPRSGILNSQNQVPVMAPAHPQAAFHGPQQFDMAHQMTNWAARKFVSREQPQAFLGPQSPPQHSFGRPAQSQSTRNGTSSNQSQLYSRSSDPVSEQGFARSLSPASPHTAPIQDTVYQRSSSSSTTDSTQSKASKPPVSASRNPGLLAHQPNPNVSNSFGDDRQNQANSVTDFYPFLKPITEDTPDMYSETRTSAGASNFGYPQSFKHQSNDWLSNGSHQGNPGPGRYVASTWPSEADGLHQSQMRDDPQNFRSRTSHSSQGFSNPVMDINRGLSSHPSLDSNSRSSYRSGGSYRSSHDQKAGGSSNLRSRRNSNQSMTPAFSQDALNEELRCNEAYQKQENVHRRQKRPIGSESSDWASHTKPAPPRASLRPQTSLGLQSMPSGGSMRMDLPWPNGQESNHESGFNHTMSHHNSSNPELNHHEDHPQCGFEGPDMEDKAERSSLDEQVHFLQQRHNAMHSHGDPEKACTSPFADPFGRSANPFQQMSTGLG